MGVHDSAVWKEVDAFTRLNIRWRSTKDNVTNMSISVFTYYQSTGNSMENYSSDATLMITAFATNTKSMLCVICH